MHCAARAHGASEPGLAGVDFQKCETNLDIGALHSRECLDGNLGSASVRGTDIIQDVRFHAGLR